MERTIQEVVKGFRTQDGAGVSLVRVLGINTVRVFDPILLLDSFDSTNPSDYTAGFPMHPHRGIETISYVFRGSMTHRDSLGNTDTIGDGEVQWMTAGSGILHEEKLPASERLLGVQLWLNLPAKDKMVPPAYRSIKRNEIPEVPIPQGLVRVLAGEYQGVQGFISQYLPMDYYDVQLKDEEELVIEMAKDRSVLVFTLLGDAYVGGERVAEKTAVKLTPGESLRLKATDQPAQVLYVSSVLLEEPISWGGPIVMNTKAELNHAFEELQAGTFLKEGIHY